MKSKATEQQMKSAMQLGTSMTPSNKAYANQFTLHTKNQTPKQTTKTILVFKNTLIKVVFCCCELLGKNWHFLNSYVYTPFTGLNMDN
jgi:hypothetical protein